MKTTLSLSVLLLFLLATFTSCSHSSKTHAGKGGLGGTVSVAGKLVERGKLYLDPKGNGSPVSTDVQVGRYTISTDAGTVVGPYVARIVVYPDPSGGGPVDPLGISKMKLKNVVVSNPQEFSVDIDIPAGAHNFDIPFPSGGPTP
jgi:hypothetical protein